MSEEFHYVNYFKTKEDACLAHEFYQDFHLYTDFGGHVLHVDADHPDDFFRSRPWRCAIQKGGARFTTTLDKMSSGYSDFMKGIRVMEDRLDELLIARLQKLVDDHRVGEPMTDPNEPTFWVERITKAGKITLSPTQPKLKKTWEDTWR